MPQRGQSFSHRPTVAYNRLLLRGTLFILGPIWTRERIYNVMYYNELQYKNTLQTFFVIQFFCLGWNICLKESTVTQFTCTVYANNLSYVNLKTQIVYNKRWQLMRQWTHFSFLFFRMPSFLFNSHS